MEERLINAVANHPELYDASSFLYRDRNKKDLAWRNISDKLGQPEDICRRKWKSLRDTYNKEKRTEKEKRSLQQDRGGDGSSSRSWGFWTPSSPRGRLAAIWWGPWRTSPPRTRDSPERQQGSVSQKVCLQ
ncbi:transcription factor Adf-1-like [Oreochromis niloticus]|uniref:transcription factor Adf-1-like n=1 Tax=Oreochromis niloticus TaxID=8128 RepID=UPI000904BAC1|nr:transcription factor Adf-1-like [Oreochromis niloticus]